MIKIRPFSLTTIAWLFIVLGVLSAYDLVSQFWQPRHSLNIGFLLIFLGRGLLRLSPVAHSWAIAVVFLNWLLLVFACVLGFCGGDIRLGHESITGSQRALVLLGFILAYGTVLTWMTRVLFRPDVAELFQDHEDSP